MGTWCYRQPTRLQFDEWVVESSCGVQQGDPLGPLLFAAALQPIANDLRGVGLDIAVHYLDDGFLAGDVSAVSRALHLVQTEAAAIGSSLTSPKASWLPWAGLTLAPCTAIFLMLSFGTLPPVPPGCAATMNSLVQPLGTTPSPVRTLPTGRPRRGTYSMLWGSWRIPRWHCGFCVAVLDSLACCIACGATRPPRKLWL